MKRRAPGDPGKVSFSRSQAQCKDGPRRRAANSLQRPGSLRGVAPPPRYFRDSSRQSGALATQGFLRVHLEEGLGPQRRSFSLSSLNLELSPLVLIQRAIRVTGKAHSPLCCPPGSPSVPLDTLVSKLRCPLLQTPRANLLLLKARGFCIWKPLEFTQETLKAVAFTDKKTSDNQLYDIMNKKTILTMAAGGGGRILKNKHKK